MPSEDDVSVGEVLYEARETAVKAFFFGAEGMLCRTARWLTASSELWLVMCK